METWNSANGFIFFGRGGEVAGSRVDDQLASVAALHLLQSCLGLCCKNLRDEDLRRRAEDRRS